MQRSRLFTLFFTTSAVIVLFNLHVAEGILRRCYQCRSRGDLGSCKDPFRFNATQIEDVRGITAVPCASGWCGKVIEGASSFREDDYDIATQRMCVQRGPSDSEDRCAYTVFNHKKVFMCFCQGDLCNSAPRRHQNFHFIFSIAILIALLSSYRNR
ncbi:protein quiver [Lutzomyia longipalpis]|nr:protein quiver [Lutzomyia longipalpis]